MKKLYIVIAIFAPIGFTFFAPDAMISPGSLRAEHASLDNNCFACHKAFQGVISAQCIHCHPLELMGHEDNEYTTKPKENFHINMSGKSCTSCHSEHKGRKGLP